MLSSTQGEECTIQVGSCKCKVDTQESICPVRKTIEGKATNDQKDCNLVSRLVAAFIFATRHRLCTQSALTFGFAKMACAHRIDGAKCTMILKRLDQVIVQETASDRR